MANTINGKRCHFLKTVQPYFDLQLSGVKQFEYRKNDRDYRVGDLLVLREYFAREKRYSGRELVAEVLFIIAGNDTVNLPDGWVLLCTRPAANLAPCPAMPAGAPGEWQ